MGRHDGAEIAGALLLGCVVTTAMTVILGDSAILSNIYVQSDFAHYCEAADSVRQGLDGPRTQRRSWLAAQLPGLLSSRVGIVDGFGITALVATAAMVGAVALWAGVLAGRVAGVAAAISVACFTPLVVLPRHLTFYPQMTAAIALCGLSTALVLRRRDMGSLVLGTAIPCLAALLHIQSLFFVFSALGVSFLAALFPFDLWTTIKRTGVFLGLVSVAWVGGQYAYPNVHRNSLESEVFRYVQTLENPARNTGSAVAEVEACKIPAGEGFGWGNPNPQRIFDTWNCLNDLRKQADVRLKYVPDSQAVTDFRAHRDPWWPVLAVSLGVVLIGLRRRPLEAVGLVMTLIPYLVYLIYGEVDGTIRRLTVGFVAAPVLLGVALRIVLGGAFGSVFAKRTVKAWVPWIVGGALLGWFGLVLGVPATVVGPHAAWRSIVPTSSELNLTDGWTDDESEGRRICHQALKTDRADGIPKLGRLGSLYTSWRSHH
jgi:MFS family permease